MEGHRYRPCRAPQVVRSFTPTRLTDELLAGVYERLLQVAAHDLAGGQGQVVERTRQPLSLDQDHLLTTGGRT
jgi:RNase P/RNase MRP subunit p29